MRVIAPILISSLLLFGCQEQPEPQSELPRIRASEPSASADREGVAQAQAGENRRVAPPRPAPRPTPAAAPAAADVQPHAGNQRAPDNFTARLVTTKGNIDIEVHRAWAPHGADRFYTLIREGFFTDIAMFRVVAGFMAQGGIHGDPAVAARWRSRRMPDDPVRQSNRRGYVSYAMAGPGSRTTQFFINLVDNSRLDGMGFAPFGQVSDMSVVDQLYSGYGEGAPRGRGPAQARIQSEGNTYLRAEFPDMDYIRSASVL